MRACLVSALLLVVAGANAAKLPSTWQTCVINQPGTDACLAKNIQTAIHDLAVKGSPSLGVYPIDPLRVTKLSLSSGSGSFVLDLTFFDLDIFGLKNLNIEEVKSDIPNGVLKFSRGTIKSDLVLSGDYAVKGRLLVVPIGGTGRCNITLGNPVKVDGRLALSKYKGPDGRTFARVDDFQFDFSQKTFTLNFHDKEIGGTALGATLNRIANDNSREILKDLKPAISNAFGQAFQDIANRILSKVPFNEVFPSK
ncbi:protein takeout-like [Thrips palmi]|uniref:Protein takeout-like n=1 Tax=Thrips palmi TaxID=161013 RepID=A0A6P8ZRT4_THRPL|nr:protein takeout-like [Thrips palmi]